MPIFLPDCSTDAAAISELTPEAARLLLIAVGGMGFCLGWLLWQSNFVSLLRWTFATLLLLAIDALCLVLPPTHAIHACAADVVR